MELTEQLKVLFERHQMIQFPKDSFCPELRDWLDDLAEMDTYIAGLASSYISGGKDKISNTVKRDLDVFASRLTAIAADKDPILTKAHRDELQSLAAMWRLICEISKGPNGARGN